MNRLPMTFPNDDKIKKSLISVVVEKTLLEIGKPEYQKVVNKLKEDYNCFLPDCYENPTYLKKVLEEIFGQSYDVIYESIKTKLRNVESNKQINDFLKVLEK